MLYFFQQNCFPKWREMGAMMVVEETTSGSHLWKTMDSKRNLGWEKHQLTQNRFHKFGKSKYLEIIFKWYKIGALSVSQETISGSATWGASWGCSSSLSHPLGGGGGKMLSTAQLLFQKHFSTPSRGLGWSSQCCCVILWPDGDHYALGGPLYSLGSLLRSGAAQWPGQHGEDPQEAGT